LQSTRLLTYKPMFKNIINKIFANRDRYISKWYHLEIKSDYYGVEPEHSKLIFEELKPAGISIVSTGNQYLLIAYRQTNDSDQSATVEKHMTPLLKKYGYDLKKVLFDGDPR